MPQSKVKGAPQEKEKRRLEKLDKWVYDSGFRWAWFSREINLSRVYVSGQVTGYLKLSERFVLSCFNRFPELPPDTFKDHGYMRGDGCVYKRLELEVASGEN